GGRRRRDRDDAFDVAAAQALESGRLVPVEDELVARDERLIVGPEGAAADELDPVDSRLRERRRGDGDGDGHKAKGESETVAPHIPIIPLPARKLELRPRRINRWIEWPSFV